MSLDRVWISVLFKPQMWHILAQFRRNLAEVQKQTGQVLYTPHDKFTEEEERQERWRYAKKRIKHWLFYKRWWTERYDKPKTIGFHLWQVLICAQLKPNQ